MISNFIKFDNNFWQIAEWDNLTRTVVLWSVLDSKTVRIPMFYLSNPGFTKALNIEWMYDMKYNSNIEICGVEYTILDVNKDRGVISLSTKEGDIVDVPFRVILDRKLYEELRVKIIHHPTKENTGA